MVMIIKKVNILLYIVDEISKICDSGLISNNNSKNYLIQDYIRVELNKKKNCQCDF